MKASFKHGFLSSRANYASSHQELFDRYKKGDQLKNDRFLTDLKKSLKIRKVTSGEFITPRSESSKPSKPAFLTSVALNTLKTESNSTYLPGIPTPVNFTTTAKSTFKTTPRHRARMEIEAKFSKIFEDCERVEEELRDLEATKDFDLSLIRKKIGYDEVIRRQKEEESDKVGETLKEMLYEDIQNLSINRKVVLKNVQNRGRKKKSKLITTKLIEEPKLLYKDHTVTLFTENLAS